MSIELWWGSGSMPSRRVMLALAVKGLPYEGHLVSFAARDTRKPEFLAMNPRGKVPTIRDGDFTLSESLAILAWLDAKQPEPPLFGRNANELGHVWRLCMEHENHFDHAWRNSLRPIAFGQAQEKADEIRAGLPAMHDELRGLEPVDVGVRDAQVVGDVAEDRGVVALQDAAGQLHADQETDDPAEVQRRCRDLSHVTGHAVTGPSGSLSIRRWYHSTPSAKASTPMCSSYEWIAWRCALVMRNGV